MNSLIINLQAKKNLQARCQSLRLFEVLLACASYKRGRLLVGSAVSGDGDNSSSHCLRKMVESRERWLKVQRSLLRQTPGNLVLSVSE